MTSALEGVSGQQHATAALYLREKHGTHFKGGCVGTRGGLERLKISSQPGFDPRAFQPVASCYTDWATEPTADIMNFKKMTVVCWISSYFSG